MDPSSILMPSSLQNAAVFTIVLAFAGYLVTFMINRMMARRADRLRLVNQRLNEFYGPLYVATVAGNIAYNSLLKKQGKTAVPSHPRRGFEGVDAVDDDHLHAAQQRARKDHH